MSDPIGRVAANAVSQAADTHSRRVGDVNSVAGSGKTPREKLRQASHDLEGLFVNELFKAMRATLPQDGILSSAPGQDMFQGMMDEKLADMYATKSVHGLGESLYRQLGRRLQDGSQP